MFYLSMPTVCVISAKSPRFVLDISLSFGANVRFLGVIVRTVSCIPSSNIAPGLLAGVRTIAVSLSDISESPVVATIA
jgi:hypothetical protein